MTPTQYCDFAGPQYLLFNEAIPSLVYISHIPIMVIAFLLGLFVLWSSPGSLQNRLFFFAMLFFGTWVFFDSLFWASNRSDVIMFVWSMLVFIEPLVHISLIYLLYILATKQDAPFHFKLLAMAIYLPQFFLIPTAFTLDGFDIANCLPNEATFSYYSYFTESLFILWFLILTIRFLRSESVTKEIKQEVRLLSAGIGIFLISFTGGNIYGTLTDDWVVGAVGLFGMILLAIFIAFSIIRYQTFNSRVIATQFLVLFIVFLIGSQLFNYESRVGLILSLTTLILSSVAGYFLVRSVKYEIRQKENMERISRSLAQANERLKELDTAKSEFISIASHQLRTPLTAIKGYVSLILEGSYGNVNTDVQDVLNKVYSVNNRLAQLVEDLLNISRIEAGRIQYNFQPTQVADIVSELHDMFLLPAKEKGLEFNLVLPELHLPKILVDPNKIKEVVSNLVDNSIKYTPTGTVTLSLEEKNGYARITIADTGIGIKPEDKDNLFNKFVRSKETSRMAVGGAGLGLYVGKSFIKAHKGNIWADSEGPGKGSQFVIELPINNTMIQQGKTEETREA